MQPLDEDLKGSYLLLCELTEDTEIEVGRLGRLFFPQGTYVYTGSALNGLNGRLRRHFSREKTLHWHIDYLLVHAEPFTALVLPSENRLECALNRMVASLEDSEEVKGFGASDCGCSSHLHRLNEDTVEYLLQGFREEFKVTP